MRVLLVGSRAPERQGTGDAKLAFNARAALTAAGHQVSIVVLQREPAPARAMYTLGALLTGQPLQIGMTASPSTRKRIQQLAAEQPPDLVVAVHARAAAQVPRKLRARGLALIIDAYGRNYQTYPGHISKPLELVYRVEQRRMVRLERNIVAEFARTAVVSDLDVSYLQQFATDQAAVVRLTYSVDLDFFGAIARRPMTDPPVFAFVGRLNYLPNRDAVRWLATEIWPALRRRWPSARMRVIGARPDRPLRRMLDRAGIELVADALDIRPSLEDVVGLLVPMRMGGGIQTKMLEGMAASVPVLSTAFGCRGIGAQPDAEVLLAETPPDYVRQAERLVGDARFAASLAAGGRAFVQRHHAPALFERDLLETCAAIAAQTEQESSRIIGRT